MRDLNVTIIQTDLAWHDAETNCTRLDGVIRSIAGPTDLVLLPEMFSTGFTMEPAACAEGMDGIAVKRLLEWAREKNADAAGSVAVREEGRFYNRLVWARPGGSVITYDKRHLFRMAGEEKVYTAGGARPVIELNGWKIRPFICYDLRFPVWSRNRNLEYDIAVYVANWPEKRAAHWRALLRARAIENQCYVIGVNRIGADGNGVSYCGDSAVIDFTGNTLFEKGNGECAATVALSFGVLADYRRAFPAWKDADEFVLP
ncbi:MAG TPA: amidohydrolase [Spirochaetota bacterium]|nr:amidohydrolase [Spirochaetota bacterium]HPC40563.1 amidohydrolase [Spirochaetota bacterium]HPL18388.1 amidohydrolase [Spirochaetota bacterium]HQF07929.1 amidohydrolase [Spirochaetota bacterium]HQH96489.1 amidohydrolase [Spirochaetota bacterium]